MGLERPSSTLGYFNIKGVQGSSPTASLAADLSQNFRIDNEARLVDMRRHMAYRPVIRSSANRRALSPRFPTPRRALFTAQALGALDTRRMAAPVELGWCRF